MDKKTRKAINDNTAALRRMFEYTNERHDKLAAQVSISDAEQRARHESLRRLVYILAAAVTVEAVAFVWLIVKVCA